MMWVLNCRIVLAEATSHRPGHWLDFLWAGNVRPAYSGCELGSSLGPEDVSALTRGSVATERLSAGGNSSQDVATHSS